MPNTSVSSVVPAQAWDRLGAFYVAGALCLLIPTALVTVYTLNLFYRTGAIVWDTALFSELASFSDSWPMLWPDYQHRDAGELRPVFFSNHVMLIFYVTSAVHHFLPLVPAAAYFSLLQGLWCGLIGLSVFILCRSTVAALATALCGPVLSAVGWPHIELAIPALLLLSLSLRSSGYRLASYGALALCLLVREDAGLHAGGLLFLMAVVRRDRRDLMTAFVCTAYSIVAVALQHFVYPIDPSQLEQIYLGRPWGSRFSWALARDRLPHFLVDRAYATWPVFILLGIALWWRSALLAIGALAVLPWILLSLLAVEGDRLQAYYSFPLILTIAWPSVAYGAVAARLQIGLSLASIALFVGLGANNVDDTPWRGLDVPEFHAIGSYEASLRDAVNRGRRHGRLMVDDAVVSLIPESIAVDEWAFQWAVDHLPNPDTVIYLPSARPQANAKRVVDTSGLTYECRITGTPFVVASRDSGSRCAGTLGVVEASGAGWR